MRTRNPALDTIRDAIRGRGRVRAEKPRDADPEMCRDGCAEPSLCGPGCWATRLLQKAARLRATLGAPGRRHNPVAEALERLGRIYGDRAKRSAR